MKNYHIILSALAIAAAFTACSKQVETEAPETAPESTENLIDITLTANCDDVRATLSGSQVLWAEGDQILVHDGTGVRTFSLVAGAGTKTATFSGPVESGATTLKALFPASAGSWNGSSFDYTIPDEQDATTQSIDPAALVATGTGSVEDGLTFSNAISLLRFSVEAEVTRVIFHTRNKEAIAGSSPYLFVSLPGTAGTFEAAINPGTYDGIRAFLTNGSGTFLKEGTSTLTLAANEGQPLGTISSSTEVKAITTPDELIAYLGGSPTLDAYICKDLDLTGKSLTSCASFANVFDGQYHSISKLTTNASAPMFTANTGTVENFTLEDDCVFTLPGELAAGTYAFVIGNNSNGTVSGVTNKADVTEWTGEITGAINVGIIVGSGLSSSVISNCRNEGSITIHSPEHGGVGTAVFGGVCGKLSSSTTSATDCVNTGAISFDSGMNASSANLYIAGVVGNSSSGVVTRRCSNEGAITVNVTKSSSAIIAAGVNSYTSGLIEDCTNSGNISVTSANYTQAVAIGGIAAYSSKAIRGTTKDAISNTGALSLTAQYFYQRNNVGSVNGTDTKTSGCIAIGGVVGYTYSSKFSLSNAKNEGSITMRLAAQENQLAPASSGRFTIGGLVADGSGPISDSDNFGDVDVSIRATSGTFTATTNGLTTYMGGIVGSNYTSLTQSELDITNCHNEGSITFHSDNTGTANCAVAGIVGWPGTETDCDSITSNCINGSSTDPSKGAITVSGNMTVRAGGIQGGSGRIQNCTNYGKIWGKSGKIAIGGLGGFHGGGYEVTGSHNYGPVQGDVKATGLGGLFGTLQDADLSTGTGCSVNCTLTSSKTTEIGIVVGHFGGNTGTIVLGTDGDPIEVAGTVKGTVLNADNYGSYLYGPAKYDSNFHTIHATYSE